MFYSIVVVDGLVNIVLQWLKVNSDMVQNMIRLRNYQLQSTKDIHAAWVEARSVLAVLPTGGGKTVVFTSIMREHNGYSAAIVHRREIVSQISLALASLGVVHRIVAPDKTVREIRRKHLKTLNKSFIDPQSKVGVMSVQTLTSKASRNDKSLQAWVKQITLAVYDEGHHYVKKGLWSKAVECMTNAKLLFVSATPSRADGLGLDHKADGFVETMIEGPTTKWLIEQGFLSSFKYIAPASDLDVSGIPITASGDFNAKALRERVVDSHLVGDVVNHYTERCAGKRCLVFATDVKTADEIASKFMSLDIPAVALSGKTDSRERDAAIESFANSEQFVLVNVDLFDEGFDVPAAEAVILARPTESLGKFLQMVGRVLRVVYSKDHDITTQAGRLAAIAAGPKPHAIIIDPVRNWERHGLPNWPRVWDIEGMRGARASSAGTVPQYVCPSCTQPYEKFHVVCPYCGEKPPLPVERKTPESVDGDMTELDVDALAALFDKVEAANKTPEEFSRELAAKNVPHVGRNRLLNLHKDALHRRTVLRELVAWWMGTQPEDRTKGEKQKRFYIRFGIDVANALTLTAKETDVLITKIQEGFKNDL